MPKEEIIAQIAAMKSDEEVTLTEAAQADLDRELARRRLNELDEIVGRNIARMSELDAKLAQAAELAENINARRTELVHAGLAIERERQELIDTLGRG